MAIGDTIHERHERTKQEQDEDANRTPKLDDSLGNDRVSRPSEWRFKGGRVTPVAVFILPPARRAQFDVGHTRILHFFDAIYNPLTFSCMRNWLANR
jgi:hypothetical protein